MDTTPFAPDTVSQCGPTWLDLEYIKKIIQRYTNNQLVEIKSFKVSSATAKGENYLSALYMLDVRYKNNVDDESETWERSFMLKTRLENELVEQLEEHLDVFVREAQYYTAISDEIDKLLGADVSIFGPKTVYVDERIIVMENLKLRGYSIGDVKQGLNESQCLLVLRKLGKFHAVSMVLYGKNPDIFRFHLPGNISDHPSPMHMIYKACVKTTIEYCNATEDLKKFVPKLEVFGQSIIAKLINVYSRNLNDRYHVLNHGDVWVNNLMFHAHEPDVLFIDFQEGFYGSPGIDLNYLIFTSLQADVFQCHFDDLVLAYHQSLCDTLVELNYQHRIPTLDDVKKEIYSKGFHGLATATCLLPILINENTELADPENFVLETDEAIQNRRKIFYNQNFGDRLKIFLKFFEDFGIL
ncbi:uncharacterized protein LOC106089560 [Stomoxys calcitrans]|uniref:CHK kinase-like domain-containing protein n=1 Tax=Stomoxys calcitrans TaxID=35570 RepID=A0A1I8P124_STOCA|nr:uncharacterized protein LOC106089560 [Stomoxys calcitrans]